MHSLIQRTRTTSLFLILLGLACFGLSPSAQAVLPPPPPDGGYPGQNTAEGQSALDSLTTGDRNTAIGFRALFSNTEGGRNTATGAGALLNNTTGNSNTATGNLALGGNINGRGNTATGDSALSSNTEGVQNTATGLSALGNNTTGDGNTANGLNALIFNKAGNRNTAVGAFALVNNFTGNNNVALGNQAGLGVSTADDVICIGASGANVSHTCYIGNIFNQTSVNGMPVLINSANKLGTNTSSKRFKEEIKAMNQASETLFALKPVTFQYKKEIDSAGTTQFGLVAEDVLKVNPDLVVRDQEGKPYGVRYDQVNAMLLNEFLKEHRRVQDLECALEELGARLKEQNSKVQKMSDQLAAAELRPVGRAPRVVERQ